MGTLLLLATLLGFQEDPAAEFKKHAVEVGPVAVWIERKGFSLIPTAPTEGAASWALNATSPVLVFAHWEGDLDKLATELVLPVVAHGGIMRGVAYGGEAPEGRHYPLAQESFDRAKPVDVRALFKQWPAWDDALPHLGLQEGVLVVARKSEWPEGAESEVPDALILAAKSKSPRLRLVALHALRHVARPAAVETAIAALDDKDPKVAAVAKDTLRHHLGRDVKDFHGEWKSRKENLKYRPISAAEFSMSDYAVGLPYPAWGRDLSGCIRRYLRHPEARVRRDAAILAWASGDDKVVASLEEIVDDKEPRVRAAVLQAFGRIDTVRATPALRKGLGDPDREVRKTAIAWTPDSELDAIADRIEKESDAYLRQWLAIRLYRGRRTEPLAAAFEREKDRELKALLAMQLVMLDSRRSAARHLVDAVLDSGSKHSLFASYALNRMIEPTGFDRLTSIDWSRPSGCGTRSGKYPPENLKDAMSELEEKGGFTAALDLGPGFPIEGRGRMFPETPVDVKLPTLLDFILPQDPEKPRGTFLLKGTTVTLVPFEKAVEFWKDWRINSER